MDGYKKRVILWNRKERKTDYIIPKIRSISISTLKRECEIEDEYDLGIKKYSHYDLSDKNYERFSKVLWGLVRDGNADYFVGVGEYFVFLIK